MSEFLCGPDSYFPLGLCRSPWTLAVAVVLLPVIVQILSSLREPAQLQVLVGVVDVVVQRFSPSILACKSEEHNVFPFFPVFLKTMMPCTVHDGFFFLPSLPASHSLQREPSLAACPRPLISNRGPPATVHYTRPGLPWESG